MKTVAVYEAKTRLSEILAYVEQGEHVTITRHGHPVARLIALEPNIASVSMEPQSVPERGDLIARIKATRQGCSLDDMDIRAAMEEGRD